MTSRRTVPAVLVLVSAALGLTACAGGSDEDTIQVYSARHYDLETAFEEFNAETGIKVEFLFGEDAELRERIAAEGEDTVADAYITVDAGNLAAAAEQGIFRPVESTELEDAVPANLRDPEGRWFGLAKRVRTIAYSTERVEESELSTYEALTDPTWQGRLCLRTAQDSYTQSLVASMIAARGEEETQDIVRGWVENGEIFSNDVEIIDNIASGRCDVGIVNHYYLARELREDPDLPVGLFWADQEEDGVHVNISGGGVTADADNPEDATRLLEWLATDGQQTLVGENLEYPVNPDVDPDPLLQELGDFREQTIDATAYADLNAEAVELLAFVGYR
jgi:iron(III) transport system substrate-binding protein